MATDHDPAETAQSLSVYKLKCLLNAVGNADKEYIDNEGRVAAEFAPENMIDAVLYACPEIKAHLFNFLQRKYMTNDAELHSGADAHTGGTPKGVNKLRQAVTQQNQVNRSPFESVFPYTEKVSRTYTFFSAERTSN